MIIMKEEATKNAPHFSSNKLCQKPKVFEHAQKSPKRFLTFHNLYTIKNWLLDSGIQNTGKGRHINGGFNSWFSMGKKNYPFIYSEITGYGITTLLFLHETEKNKIYIERAELAAGWILNEALHTCGGVKARAYYSKNEVNDSYSFEKGNIFAFDTAMVLFGLSNLYKKTKKEKYLEASKKIADFLVRMQKGNGQFFAFYNPGSDSFGDIDDKWSNQSGSYHAKIALGLLSIYDTTKKDAYKNSAIKACDSALKFQKEDGRFVTSRKDSTTHQHPHCYSAEGLLYCGLKLGIKKYIDSAIRAIKWSLNSQLENGGMPQIYEQNPARFVEYERTDILSQVLRLGLLANSCCNPETASIKKLERLKNRLLSFQNPDGPQKGGIFYGSEYDGKRYKDLNAWCSMFALQALYFLKLFKDGKRLNMDLLV